MLPNESWVYSKDMYNLLDLNNPQIELAYDIQNTFRYQQTIGTRMEAFPEVSGILDENDPLEKFEAYLLDPVNWDPTLS
ncbi:hypothetical protein [Candidatus Nitrospira salsa]